jgi:hypothetical protein
MCDLLPDIDAVVSVAGSCFDLQDDILVMWADEVMVVLGGDHELMIQAGLNGGTVGRQGINGRNVSYIDN